jgi:hypothetical protein
MIQSSLTAGNTLRLRPGELVRVRSAADIMATLDAGGRLDALPFMPEMLSCCGKQFRVYKRADKSCDTVGTSPTHALRMTNTVHLEGVRCSGAAHGGCQAACLVFWKEAWLERVTGSSAAAAEAPAAHTPAENDPAAAAALARATRRIPASGEVHASAR